MIEKIQGISPLEINATTSIDYNALEVILIPTIGPDDNAVRIYGLAITDFSFYKDKDEVFPVSCIETGTGGIYIFTFNDQNWKLDRFELVKPGFEFKSSL